MHSRFHILCVEFSVFITLYKANTSQIEKCHNRRDHNTSTLVRYACHHILNWVACFGRLLKTAVHYPKSKLKVCVWDVFIFILTNNEHFWLNIIKMLNMITLNFTHSTYLAHMVEVGVTYFQLWLILFFPYKHLWPTKVITDLIFFDKDQSILFPTYKSQGTIITLKT